MPLNFVDIAQNPSLAIYKIVLVFAFRLVRWDGRWMKWQANHWKCIVQKRALIPILSTMWLPANKSSERLKEVSVMYLIKKKKTEMMGISIVKEGTWQGSQQAKTLKMHLRCMLSLVPCIYIYILMYPVCFLLFYRKVDKGKAECTKASLREITKCRFLMFNC